MSCNDYFTNNIFLQYESNHKYSENFMFAKISRPRVGSGTNTVTSEVHYLSLCLLLTPQGFSSLNASLSTISKNEKTAAQLKWRHYLWQGMYTPLRQRSYLTIFPAWDTVPISPVTPSPVDEAWQWYCVQRTWLTIYGQGQSPNCLSCSPHLSQPGWWGLVLSQIFPVDDSIKLKFVQGQSHMFSCEGLGNCCHGNSITIQRECSSGLMKVIIKVQRSWLGRTWSCDSNN